MHGKRNATKAILAGALALSMTAGSAQAVETLVYATYLSDVYSVSKASNWLLDEIERRSNGEIVFERYTGGSLLRAADLFPGLSSGAVDIVSGAPHAYNVNEYALANILMPYMTSQVDAMALAWGELYRNNADFRNSYESQGVRPLFVAPYSENSIWSRRPIETVADFAGLKVRAVPPVSIALNALGATPVALTWPEGVDGLSRGVVEAMSTAPFDSAVNAGLYEVAPYVTYAASGALGVATIAIGTERYDSLSPELQAIIDEVAAEATAMGLEFLDQTTDEAVERLCALETPITVTRFSDEEAANARALVTPSLEQAWSQRVSADSGINTAAMLTEFKGYIAQYEATSTYVPGIDRYLAACPVN